MPTYSSTPPLARPRRQPPPLPALIIAILATIAFLIAAFAVTLHRNQERPPGKGFTSLGSVDGVKVWGKRYRANGTAMLAVATSHDYCNTSGPEEYDGVPVCAGGAAGKAWTLGYVVPKSAASAQVATSAGQLSLDVLHAPPDWPYDVAFTVVKGTRAHDIVPTAAVQVRDASGALVPVGKR